MHTDEIRPLFGEVAHFSSANRGPVSRYFKVSRSMNGTASAKDSYTNGYQPQPWMRKALDWVIGSGTGLDFCDERGRVLSAFSRAIRSTDTHGHVVKRWKGVDVPVLIPVNIDNLRALQAKWEYLQSLPPKEQTSRAIFDRYELNEQATVRAFQQTKIFIAESQAKRHPGMLPIRYVLHASGRLYAEGLNLQSCKREIRQAALAGYWDIDISNCHFSIMAQMAKQFGLPCPAIDDYVMRKGCWRNVIAQEVGITKKLVKKALNALGYGAPRSTSTYNEIPAQLGKERAAAFFKHHLAMALKKDIDVATSVILAKHPRKNNNLINLANRAIAIQDGEGGKVKKSSLMSHLLQGVEAAALEAAVRACRGKVLLLQHDGFSATEYIEPEYLRAAVLEGTGYDLNFEVEKIQMPLTCLDIPEQFFNEKEDFTKKPNSDKYLQPFWPVWSGTMALSAEDVPPVFPLPLPLIDTDF